MSRLAFSQYNDNEFDVATRSLFHFLVRDYGFSITSSTPSDVMYTRDFISISVFQEVGSRMVYLELSRNDLGERYTMHEMLTAIASTKASLAQCRGSDDASLYRCLKQLSDLSRTHLAPLFKLDETMFRTVAATAQLMRQQLTLNAEFHVIKHKANSAWQRKDWKAALELYLASEPSLSSAERRRLAYLQEASKNSKI